MNSNENQNDDEFMLRDFGNSVRIWSLFNDDIFCQDDCVQNDLKKKKDNEGEIQLLNLKEEK